MNAIFRFIIVAFSLLLSTQALATPSAVPDTFNILEDSNNNIGYVELDVLANDNNEGLTLFFNSLSDLDDVPNKGRVLFSNTNRKVKYVLEPNFNGTKVFSYQIGYIDPNNPNNQITGNTVKVTVVVAPVNDTPVAVADKVMANQGLNIIDVLQNDSDIDGDTLSIASVTTPNKGGVATINGTKINYTPASGFSGEETFDYIVNDGTVDGQAVTVTTSVNNNAPVITGGDTTTISAFEGLKFVTDVDSTDETQSDTFLTTLSGPDADKFIITDKGILSFKVAPNFKNPIDADRNNSYIVVVSATDGSLVDRQTITVNIKDGLFITTNDFFVAENKATTVYLTANLNNTNFAITGGADKDKFSLINGNALTFEATDFEARDDKTYEVEITANDGTNNAVKTIVATVIKIGEYSSVTISGGGKTSTETTVTLTANVVDLDGSLAYQWEQTNNTEINTLTNTNTKNISFTTTKGMQGKTFDFKVTVTNGTKTVTATTSVEVNNNDILSTDTVAGKAVRKASKMVVSEILEQHRKTIMGRLSHLRYKQNQQSSFANGFVNGIQVSFANGETSKVINSVLSANGLSPVISTPTHKVNRWDTWTSAKVVIGTSNGSADNKTEFKLQSLNLGVDSKLGQNKTLGFALGLGFEDRTATGTDFSGNVDTTQWTLSSYGALELNPKSAIEAVFGIAKGKHKVSNTATTSDQDSDGYFASVAYRAELQTKNLNLSPFVRYDISRIKMQANDVLSNSESTTDEALALGVDISHTSNYQDGTLNRFVNLEYKSDIRRDSNDYISENAEQEISLKLGIDYQKDDTSTTINYERIQSTNGEAHSDGIEGTVRWKF